VLVVFATNLNPLELVDEAFLRRIRNKVFAESPTTEEFIRIFQSCCQERDLPFERPMIETFVRTELLDKNIPLRGCQPRDLIEHVLSLVAYTDAPKRITPRLLSAACATYFLVDNPQTK
jgi:SpoVK/Ycf46/Vps4 family AAA+-type ATPase